MAANRNYVVFTDDRDARKIAVQMQVPVSGTLGLLVLLMEQGNISLSESNALLADMIRAGYRSPIKDLSELL